MFEVDAYLKRIRYEGSLKPGAETLRALQLAHLYTVPFENLDIHLGHKIVLDVDALYNKIVERQRGGFCYELNGLFAELLRKLDFEVTMLSAGVGRTDGSYGPDFDHMTLLVKLEESWFADVGFGDSFLNPLRLAFEEEQPDSGRHYRLLRENSHLILQERNPMEDWENQYRFTLEPRKISDYQEMCRYHQTSPQSSFTQKRIISRATPEGRISLSEWKLITTSGGERKETILSNTQEYITALREHFGVDLAL